MKRMRTHLWLLAMWTVASPCLGYVQPIHKKITGRAFDISAQQTDFLQRYGWTELAPLLRNEMMYGAHAEDFLFSTVPRSLFHFFDPQGDNWRGIPLSEPSGIGGVCIALPGLAWPDPGVHMAWAWALRGDNAKNNWDLQAAHNYMWNALVGSGDFDKSMSLKRLFRSLGQVVHLLQDMAQPEHTRNDQHLPGGDIYEVWTGEHLGEDDNWLPDGTPVAPFFEPIFPAQENCESTSPWCRGYLSLFGGYFPTESGYAVGDSSGLAMLASTQFVTRDTNYSDNPACVTHQYPKLSMAVPREQWRTMDVYNPETHEFDLTFTVKETVYSYPIKDDLYSSVISDEDRFHAFHSLIDLETGRYGKRVFSLHPDAYQSRARILLPRAVGFSAALINHFFRHKMDTAFIPRNDGFFDVYVRAYSSTPDDWSASVGGKYVPPHFQIQTNNNGIPSTHAAGPHKGGPLLSSKVPQVFQGQPLYKNEIRVAYQGTLRTSGESSEYENGAVTGVIIPPKQHEVKIVLTYDASYSPGWGVFQLRVNSVGSNGNYAPVGGYTTFDTGNYDPNWPSEPGTPSSSSSNGNWTWVTPPPVNGRAEIKMAMAESTTAFVYYYLYSRLRYGPDLPVPPAPPPAHLDVLVDGNVVSQEELPFQYNSAVGTNAWYVSASRSFNGKGELAP